MSILLRPVVKDENILFLVIHKDLRVSFQVKLFSIVFFSQSKFKAVYMPESSLVVGHMEILFGFVVLVILQQYFFLSFVQKLLQKIFGSLSFPKILFLIHLIWIHAHALFYQRFYHMFLCFLAFK